MNGGDLYPPVGFHFKVDFQVDGVRNEQREARFQEVSGLRKEIGVEEYQEGGENRFTHKLPLPPSYPNLSLKRGLLLSSTLIDWCCDAIDNFAFEPTDLSVALLDEFHSPIMVWEVVGAYPVSWSASDLRAQENALVVETLELTYRYYRKRDI